MGFNELFIDDSLPQPKEVNPLDSGAVTKEETNIRKTWGNPVVFQRAE